METLNRIEEYLSKDFFNDDFFQLYSFTTENINGYMSLFDLKGKSLLTVGSSSDQVINASLVGCNDITVYDICPLTKYFYYLKISSLFVLDREEFLRFLCKTKYQEGREYNPHLLTKKTFNKIKNTLKYLDYESFYIWEHIFGNYSRKDIEKLFRRDINNLESIVYCNRYLKSDYNYYYARETIMNCLINFINGDISKISINKRFDNIWLSNIAQYLKYNDVIDMVENVSNLLNIDGKILLCYFWNTSMTIKGFPIEALSSFNATKINIHGLTRKDDKNSILVYTKK